MKLIVASLLSLLFSVVLYSQTFAQTINHPPLWFRENPLQLVPERHDFMHNNYYNDRQQTFRTRRTWYSANINHSGFVTVTHFIDTAVSILDKRPITIETFVLESDDVDLALDWTHKEAVRLVNNYNHLPVVNYSVGNWSYIKLAATSPGRSPSNNLWVFVEHKNGNFFYYGVLKHDLFLMHFVFDDFSQPDFKVKLSNFSLLMAYIVLDRAEYTYLTMVTND